MLSKKHITIVSISLLILNFSIAANGKNHQQTIGGIPEGLSEKEWAHIYQQIQQDEDEQIYASLLEQQAYVKSSNTVAGYRFGFSTAISGNTIVVGARFEDEPLAVRAGVAYVFVNELGIWSQQARLVAPNIDPNDWFGYAVAIDGNTLVVGAPLEDSNATEVNGDQSDNSKVDSGAAYVFFRSDGIWQQQAYIKATNTDADDNFGLSVAIDVDTIVIGAPLEDSIATGSGGNQADNSAMDSGAVYVYQRFNLDQWSNKAYVKASNSEAFDRFGRVVDISEGLFVVGVDNESSDATGVNGDQTNNLKTNSGAAYVFTSDSGSWLQQAYLKASNTEAHDAFGRSAAVSNSTVVVGASAEDHSSTGINGDETLCCTFESGAVYVFIRDAGNIWGQQAYIKASNTGFGDFFGGAVAIDGNTIIVSASGERSNATGINGNQFNNSNLNSGAVYKYTRVASVWFQQAYIKASNSETSDYFGTAVAVSNDTILVGTYEEDSNAIGINGDEVDNSADAAGAAYVFGNQADVIFANGFESI